LLFINSGCFYAQLGGGDSPGYASLADLSIAARQRDEKLKIKFPSLPLAAERVVERSKTG